MSEFHAFIVDKSLVSQDILSHLNILSKTVDGSWVLYKISTNENELEPTVKNIQSQMVDGFWYFHAYNTDGSKLIIVFKNKTFYVNSDPKTWGQAIEYGKNFGVPIEQLDFKPNRFEDEEF
jgi:hypothetical protein